MKLDWKTFGCVMVAESGSYTAVIRNRAEEGDRWLQILDAKTGSLKHSASTTSGEEKAISECELWLEQHDRPEWNDVTDWLSWAEWRGFKLLVRKDSVDRTRSQWSASKGVDRSKFSSIAGEISKAKSAAEKWVREQGEKA